MKLSAEQKAFADRLGHRFTRPDLLQRALAAHQHHQGRTADALGLSYSQLRNSMKRLGLQNARS